MTRDDYIKWLRSGVANEMDRGIADMLQRDGETIETALDLICRAVDNVGDMPISDEWAARWTRDAEAFLSLAALKENNDE